MGDLRNLIITMIILGIGVKVIELILRNYIEEFPVLGTVSSFQNLMNSVFVIIVVVTVVLIVAYFVKKAAGKGGEDGKDEKFERDKSDDFDIEGM